MSQLPLSPGIQVELHREGTFELRLSLPARAENVAVVRQALTGWAEALAVDPAVLVDMKTAVSEACNNVVVHAYGNGDGLLEVRLTERDDCLVVHVRDTGRELPPEDERSEDRSVGLSLIQALCRHVTIETPGGGGTDVGMTFDPQEPAEDLAAREIEPLATPAPRRRSTAPLFAEDRDPLLATVLGRIVSMVAARANFSLDRLSDAQLVSDALAAHAPDHTLNGVVCIEIADSGDRTLALRVGPLRPDGGQALVSSSELPGVGLLLETLVDDVAVEAAGEGEHLHLSLSERAA